MKKYAIILLVFFIAGCGTSWQTMKGNSDSILKECPPNFNVSKLFNSSAFGYPDEAKEMAGGYLYTWNLKRTFGETESTCKFQAFVDNEGNIKNYKVPAYGEPDYNNGKLYCPYVLVFLSGMSGTVDAAGNTKCY
ncbi:hypothetical protein AAIR98_001872 [Elusimicrobium simillimum]|uniref:hypothetical protein n=1 Tax=Elusimicrobium simillimum TaxID=3143438 RepID=UPI003C6F7DAF